MESNLKEKLRVAVNQFYLEKYLDQPQLSDKEFDELAEQYKLETGESFKSLIEWEDGLTLEHDPMEPLSKTQVKDNDLKSAVVDFMAGCTCENQSYHLTYKYDGCSIKAYYKNGKLQKILGTPDEEVGIVRTESFAPLFPEQVHPEIRSIQGEVLVDAEVYGKLARNAANGLTNSKYKSDEVSKEAFIRVYRVEFVDGIWSYHRNLKALKSLPTLSWHRYRKATPISPAVQETKQYSYDTVFSAAKLLDLRDVPTTSIVYTEPGVAFQVDGLVLYSTDYVHGFKFYYTESAVTTVKEVTWTKQSNGGYAAVIQLEPITLEDKYIQKCSSNGVPKMIAEQYGRGAKVRVILANTTIPKIIDVIEPSDDFQFPKCECGYQLTDNDIFGSTLKCSNPGVCDSKVNLWLPEVASWFIDETCWGEVQSVKHAISRFPEWFGYLFHIDRWDPFDKLKQRSTLEATELDSSILTKVELTGVTDEYIAELKEWCENKFNWSELQWSNLEVNIASGAEVLRRLLELSSIENIKKYLAELNSVDNIND